MADGSPHCQEVSSVSESVVSSIPIQEFALWEKIKDKRALVSFDLELTARCNNNCRHCYINLPVNHKKAKEKELSVEEIKEIAEQAVSLGALWCLITGGEPLLRPDFENIYLTLKKLGLLVSVFTNATLIKEEHIALFRKYPPRDIEVTIYGVTQDTYERVTRKPGSFNAFMHGLDRLFKSDIKVRLKAMALRSNLDELPQIADFCRKHTKDYFRFDPFLHLRFDRNSERNQEIISERLSPAETVVLERSDPQRFESLKKGCDKFIVPEFSKHECNHLFHCGAGNGSFSLSYDGHLRLCSSLWQPDSVYDLKKGSLIDAWQNFIPKIRDIRSDRRGFLENCRVCPLINLCLWCPAHAYLETGEMDAPVDGFCQVAHARADALKK
jgi:radical SAM protein with 4Fe4S-binding SPASM domain